MVDRLQGRRVALLVADGFEQDQLLQPRASLERAGARVEVVSPSIGRVRAFHLGDWAGLVTVDVALGKAEPRNYDGLLVPGGILSADRLRAMPPAQDFVRCFTELGRPLALMGHGPWLLVDAAVAEGRRVTSASSMRTDLINAQGIWSEDPLVVDGPLVTARGSEDLQAFGRAFIEELARFRMRAESLRPPPSGPYLSSPLTLAPDMPSGVTAGDEEGWVRRTN